MANLDRSNTIIVLTALIGVGCLGQQSDSYRAVPATASANRSADAAQVYADLLRTLAPLKFAYVQKEAVPIRLEDKQQLPCLHGITLEHQSGNATHMISAESLYGIPVKLISSDALGGILRELDTQRNQHSQSAGRRARGHELT